MSKQLFNGDLDGFLASENSIRLYYYYCDFLLQFMLTNYE